MFQWPPGLRAILIWCAATVAILAAGALIVAGSGVFNVAASQGHPAAVREFLELAMRRSVELHAPNLPEGALEDIELVRLGAGHYQIGCAPCHGAPGEPQNPVAAHMLPVPPDLTEKARGWRPGELFWIVKHGLKYTGMPAWPVPEREDEVKSVAAFLRQFQDISEAEYRKMVFRRPDDALAAADPDILRDAPAAGVCARCHGDADTAPTSLLVPRLTGLSPEYIALSLRQYASGDRPSGIMQTVASGLEERQIERLAQYFSGLPVPGRPGVETPPPEAVARGRELVTEGAPQAGVPPCLTCHSAEALPTYPALAGQHVRYLANQLALWRDGLRDETPQGALMAHIARRMTVQQAEDVSAYLAALDGRTALAAPETAE